MLSGATALSGFGNPHGIAKKLKSTQGDSSSTSPERSRKEETTSDTEKRLHSNEQQHHEVSCGPTPTAGYGNRKIAVSSKSAVASKKQANATPSPMLKYLKIRVSLFSILHAWILSLTYFVKDSVSPSCIKLRLKVIRWLKFQGWVVFRVALQASISNIKTFEDNLLEQFHWSGWYHWSCIDRVPYIIGATYCKYYSRYSILYVRTRSKFIKLDLKASLLSLILYLPLSVLMSRRKL